jgi:hypothetical protein
MLFKNTYSTKLHAWMQPCLQPRHNGTVLPVYSDECIPHAMTRCAERLGVLSEQKVLLLRDPRAVALAIAHSAIAARRRGARASALTAGAARASEDGATSTRPHSRLTPPDVRSASRDTLSAATRAEVKVKVRQSFDAIAAEIAFRCVKTIMCPDASAMNRAPHRLLLPLHSND